jgi:cruciform cutting endonuclease 1
MAPKSRAVTAKALHALLTRIGSVSTGRKDVLQERFQRDVTRSRLFAPRPGMERHRDQDTGRKLRIISIDMGIKNLAYCDAEVTYPKKRTMNATMDIIRWDKLDLVKTTQEARARTSHDQVVEEKTAEVDEDVDPYSLPILSQTAYQFIKQTIVEVSPDIILIERQRWRSASSAAIQQWTVRVNTLEAMLYAILETLRTESGMKPESNDRTMNYEVYGVDAKRVGQYWLGLHARALTERNGKAADVLEVLEDLETESPPKKIPRSKAEKKAKIALLRSWLTAESPSTKFSTPGSTPIISFTIRKGAVLAREALCMPANASTRKKKLKTSIGDREIVISTEDSSTGTEMKKLDDITDCFLQAAAWVAWESNRMSLMEAWEQRMNDAKLPEMDAEIMLEMIEAAGEA